MVKGALHIAAGLCKARQALGVVVPHRQAQQDLNARKRHRYNGFTGGAHAARSCILCHKACNIAVPAKVKCQRGRHAAKGKAEALCKAVLPACKAFLPAGHKHHTVCRHQPGCHQTEHKGVAFDIAAQRQNGQHGPFLAVRTAQPQPIGHRPAKHHARRDIAVAAHVHGADGIIDGAVVGGEKPRHTPANGRCRHRQGIIFPPRSADHGRKAGEQQHIIGQKDLPRRKAAPHLKEIPQHDQAGILRCLPCPADLARGVQRVVDAGQLGRRAPKAEFIKIRKQRLTNAKIHGKGKAERPKHRAARRDQAMQRRAAAARPAFFQRNHAPCQTGKIQHRCTRAQKPGHARQREPQRRQ